MSEFAPHTPEHHAALHESRVVLAEFMLEEGPTPVRLPAIETSRGTTYLIEKGNSWQTERSLGAMDAAGIVCRVLPAESDTLTADEAEYARTLPHNRPMFAKNPLAPQLEREALVFTPTAKSMLDIMIRAGHDDAEIRQARRASVRGEANKIVDTLDVITGHITEERQLDKDADPVNYRKHHVVSASLDIHDTALSLAQGLAERGLEYGSYRALRTRLSHGIKPELIRDSVGPDAEVLSLLQNSWEQAIALAKTYNTDQYKDGIYTELHKVGDVIIPLPAIASTAWEAADTGIGYVAEDSGHTLAEIYAHGSLRGEPAPGSIDAAVFNKDTADLVKAYGLPYRGTLVERCRTVFDETGRPIILLPDAEKNIYRTTLSKRLKRQTVTASLHQLGIATKDLTPGAEHVMTLESEHAGTFTSTVKEVELPQEKQRYASDKGYQMVLAGVNLQPGTTSLEWAGANARRHADIYEALDLPENSMASMTIGGKEFRVAARYQGDDLGELGFEENIVWIIEGDKTALLAGSAEFAQLMQSANDELISFTSSMFGSRRSNILQKVLIRGSEHERFETVVFNPNSTEA